MSSMGELTFFFSLQGKQKPNGIFISQDKYVAEILRKFGLTDRKSASTPIDTEKPLLKDPDGEDVDVHTYSDYAGVSLDRKSTTGGCQFIVQKQTALGKDSSNLLMADNLPKIVCYSTHHVTLMKSWLVQKKMANGHKDSDVWVSYIYFAEYFESFMYTNSCTFPLIIKTLTSISPFSIIPTFIMALTFADTHNMIAHLTKSDASEGFEQILDFLNASVIHYALTVNPTIYVSCIKQFWSSISIKKTNDVVRLQALIDRKKVLITEDTVRQALHLDDDESISCLPNEEIFAELARMGLVRNVDSSSKFYMYPRCLQLMISAQVGVNTPLFEGMLVPQQDAIDVADDVITDDVVAHADSEPTPPSPTPTTTPLPPQQEVASTPPLQLSLAHNNNNLHHLHNLLPSPWIFLTLCWKPDDKAEPVELKEVIEVVTTAKLKTKVVTAAATTITVAPSAARRQKSDDVIEHVKKKENKDNAVLRYQALKRKTQTEAQARKNMMHFYSVMGFLEKSKEQLEEEASKALKRKSKSSEQQEAKKQKLDEEATPLALKVPVVDYQIHTESNKPYYKIIRADGTHQLFLSFLSLLRNFNKEDLEMLWQKVQERYASSKPKNFADDFLLNTLKEMFEKPDVEAHIWKNQRGIHDDLASRKKISLDTIHSRSNAQQLQIVSAVQIVSTASIRVNTGDESKHFIQTQLLIAQKEEAGIQLQEEEYDLIAAAADLDEIDEVNANCILMANLQQASSSETGSRNLYCQWELSPGSGNALCILFPTIVTSSSLSRFISKHFLSSANSFSSSILCLLASSCSSLSPTLL
nr:retrotransposon protein, putative, unclassified [Tanacetum cinerariifolium]